MGVLTAREELEEAALAALCEFQCHFCREVVPPTVDAILNHPRLPELLRGEDTDR